MILTVDANVFVSAALRSEPHHPLSQRFLDAARDVSAEFRCPTLLPVEVAASVARVTDDDRLAMRTLRAIERRPGMQLVALSYARAAEAAKLAISRRLRGADAVYLAVAMDCDATLITWDAELLQRGSVTSSVITPGDWLNDTESH